MTEIWTKRARKGIEAVGKPVLASASIVIRWPGLPLPKPAPAEYVRFSFHPGRRIIRTMGPNGRLEASGFAKWGVFTKLGEVQDRNDTIAGIIEAAFPYNLDVSRDGITLSIGTTDHTQFVELDGWGYSSVDVNWTVWRTT